MIARNAPYGAVEMSGVRDKIDLLLIEEPAGGVDVFDLRVCIIARNAPYGVP